MIEILSRLLKSERIKSGLTLEEVAKKLDISKETLRKYEKDARFLSVALLEKILHIYQIQINIFFNIICEYIH